MNLLEFKEQWDADAHLRTSEENTRGAYRRAVREEFGDTSFQAQWVEERDWIVDGYAVKMSAELDDGVGTECTIRLGCQTIKTPIVAQMFEVGDIFLIGTLDAVVTILSRCRAEHDSVLEIDHRGDEGWRDEPATKCRLWHVKVVKP